MSRAYRVSVLALSGLAIVVSGCHAPSGGVVMGESRTRTRSHLRIWLDGNAAKQMKARKAVKGYSRFTVSRRIATAPSFKFEINDPDRFGRITMVTIQIHQERGGEYSHLAEYKIFARDGKNRAAQLKPNIEYDLGAIGRRFKILDVHDNEVSGIRLKPGWTYMFVLTVVADTSETAQVFIQS